MIITVSLSLLSVLCLKFYLDFYLSRTFKFYACRIIACFNPVFAAIQNKLLDLTSEILILFLYMIGIACINLVFLVIVI